MASLECLAMAKDLHLRNYLEVHSLCSDKVFLSIPLKSFSNFSGWTFNCSAVYFLNCSIVYFIYL